MPWQYGYLIVDASFCPCEPSLGQNSRLSDKSIKQSNTKFQLNDFRLRGVFKTNLSQYTICRSIDLPLARHMKRMYHCR
jgi:hypothetical protein